MHLTEILHGKFFFSFARKLVSNIDILLVVKISFARRRRTNRSWSCFSINDEEAELLILKSFEIKIELSLLNHTRGACVSP